MQPSKLSFEIIKYDCIKRLKLLFNELSFFFVQTIFRDIKKAFKESLAQKLDKLGVSNDGGPQHGWVLR